MKRVALQAFNDSHFNKKSANASPYKLISYNQDEHKNSNIIFKDILDAACRYDIYEKLGLTVLDLMELDFNKFSIIREKIKEITKESHNITDKFKGDNKK